MKTFIAVIISVLVFFIPACKKRETPIPIVGNKAPSFTLKDIEGRKAGLSDFSGKIVVVDFWATWCTPCKETTRELEKLHEKYKEREVVVVGISMDAGKSAGQKVKEFAEKNGLTYQMLMDDGKVSTAYAVSKIPATFVLNRRHTIVKIYTGSPPGFGDMIAGQLDGLLQGPGRGTAGR